MKVLSAKLTEQFKKHLINHENMKVDIYGRFSFIEKHLPIYRSELYKLMETSEARLLGKMKEVKDTVDLNMLANFRAQDDRMDQFSQLVDVNLDTLRKAITDNRTIFVSLINKTNDDFSIRTTSFVEDLITIQNEITETNRALQLIEKKGDENFFSI